MLPYDAYNSFLNAKDTLVYNTKLFTNVSFILCVRFNQEETY